MQFRVMNGGITMARISKEEYLPLVTPWKIVADYEDGERLYFHGNSEEAVSYTHLTLPTIA